MAEQPFDSAQVGRSVDVHERVELRVEAGQGCSGQIDDSTDFLDETAHARLILCQTLLGHLCAKLG